MAKTFYIFGEINPKHPHEPKIVVGRGILGQASEAVHAEDVRLRRLIHFDASGFLAGTLTNMVGTCIQVRMHPRLAATGKYGSITPAPRNFASFVVVSRALNGTNLGGATRNGSISFDFVAIGE